MHRFETVPLGSHETAVTVPSPVKLAIFASGAGSNAEAIIHYSYRIDAAFRVELVVSNNSRCGAVERACMFDISTAHISSYTHPDPEAYTRALLDVLREHQIDMVALAGFMKKIPAAVIDAFSPRGRSRIFNIHPSLLPKFGGQGMYGMAVHRAVLAASEKETGCTVHEVDSEYDTGTVIAQRRIPVHPHDTPEQLAQRVVEHEHELYPHVLQQQARAIQHGLL
ncbi:MAG: phosphoribosylglycinamide formyltransferase [Bacteroidota bacterium]|nr:phosphoribosylglycinamide formyltransferase [Candidatus Kapabacteria bacterium]MDW8219984.1 phosphoribosylglycinamide formyltransferase [Bacteroidota bacterium]